jgi:hypothetical protein
MINHNNDRYGSSGLPNASPASERSARVLLGYGNLELAFVDPLEMNLLVAKGVEPLAHLRIEDYLQKADDWANEIRDGLVKAEEEFHKTPLDWKNDLNFFRLGFLCYYVDQQLGIRYREDQRHLKAVSYTDADDLFLNGVMDTRRGTCANMAALHVALGWRLGWPVSLACVGSHLICRYDDGKSTHNIEATRTGGGGFHSHPDDFYSKHTACQERPLTVDPIFVLCRLANCWGSFSVCGRGISRIQAISTEPTLISWLRAAFSHVIVICN